MLKKAIKFFLLFFFLIILGLVLFRNYLLKSYLENFAHKNLKINCKIRTVNLGFNSLAINGLNLSNKNFDASAKNILLKFEFQKNAPVYLDEVNISDAAFNVKSLEGLISNVPNAKTAAVAPPISFRPIQFNLHNININVKSKSFDFNSNFSLIAEIGSDKIFLKDANIYNLKLSSQDFELANLTFQKFKKNKYFFKIPKIRIKDKEFAGLFIPVKAELNQFIFPKTKNIFLGPDGYMSAKVIFKKYNDFCFAASFKDASFEKIVNIFASDKAAFKGSFDGFVSGCVSASKIGTLEANFKNKGNGFINLKNESSLAFLKPYLDKASFDALVANFKNYEYNIGAISAKTEKNILSFNLDFTSDTMGERNIVINFHDILGGVK